MNEIIITTQKELNDYINKTDDVMLIIDSDELITIAQKFNQQICCKRGQLSVYGNAVVKSVYGNAVVEWVHDNAVVEWVSGNAVVESVSGNAVVESVHGNAVVKSVSGDAVVKSVYGNAVVEWVSGNAVVESVHGNAVVKIYSDDAKINKIFGQAVVIFQDCKKRKISKSAKSTVIYTTTESITLDSWIAKFQIQKIAKNIIIYKRISCDFKTQEKTKNETLWTIGSMVEHKNYNPEESECGDGKFHGVAIPYFADVFRDNSDDKYIAIEVAKKDCYVWPKNPEYPFKIGFRKGKVLYETDKDGDRIKEKAK